MRLLYLYPEEWTGKRAREVHTHATCTALAKQGVDVTLVTAGGLVENVAANAGLHVVNLSRKLGPIRSATIFKRRFHRWLRTQPRFDWAYIIHLKAAAMLVHEHVMPYAYETHEIFSQTPQRNEARQIRLHELERHVISGAALRVATSAPLAAALSTWFVLPKDFTVAPNAGGAPLERSVAASEGPFIYCGSIADWKGLDLVILAARDAKVPLKIVGGTKEEWQRLGAKIDTSGIDWLPRVPPGRVSDVLKSARAGLIPTQPETPSGRYSCPMKIFDYARCGLPVISTALPSLQSLDVGSWCTQVAPATREAWTDALKQFRFDSAQAEEARIWSADHTWAKRAEILIASLKSHR